MLGAIGLSRGSDDPATAAYITNVIPWRPLQNRTPADDEIAMLLPFVARHVELADPDYLLRQPALKRETWRDLLSLRAALDRTAPQSPDTA